MKYLQQICVILALLALSELGKGEDKVSNNQNVCQYQPNGAIIEYPNDCHKFYICIKQQPFEYNCDPAYHFDARTLTCLVGSSCNGDINKPTMCAEGTTRSVADDCFAFEACIKGQYQKLNCPPNYYFNIQHALCVVLKYNAQLKCNCLMPERTVMENNDNCETYFVCRNKTAVLENCPLGQYYNNTLNTCITDLDGVCLMKPTMVPSSVEDDKIIEACGDLGLQGIHFETFTKGCNTFFICINGQLYTQHCPKDFYYDSDKKYCVLDSNKKCFNGED